MSSFGNKNKWQEYKEKHGIAPLHILKTTIATVDEALAEERIAICRACPELVSSTDQCKKCGCFIQSKIAPQSAKCPLGKW